jgi:phosphoribosylamine--glycine ligase
MKVLIIGSGGREHALAWKVAQSARVDEIYCAPGNAGIASIAQCVDIQADNVAELVRFASDRSLDLTIVGPEVPLVAGLVDAFQEKGLSVFGPTQAAAVLEGSKSFMKEFCARHHLPTAAFQTFSDPELAKAYVQEQNRPLVVKTDGLAAGKGVILCHNKEDALQAINSMMCEGHFGDAGHEIIVEEFLTGEEVSFIAISDGEHIVPLASSQDHKAAFDADQGPNTGGMGAISPAAMMTMDLQDEIMDRIMKPELKSIKRENVPSQTMRKVPFKKDIFDWIFTRMENIASPAFNLNRAI